MIPSQALRYFPHFAGTPPVVLEHIAAISSVKEFRAGERLFEEGNPATHLMLVKDGRVDIVYLLGDGRQVVADTITRGDVLCWSALLPPHRLTGSAIAMEDGELIAIDGQALWKMCEREAPLGYQIMLEIAKALRNRLAGLRVQIAATK